MAIKPTRNLSSSSDSEKSYKTHKEEEYEATGSREFTARTGSGEFIAREPSAIEGGGQPPGEIPAETNKAIIEASGGISPHAAEDLGSPTDRKTRLNSLLGELQEQGGVDPYRLVEEILRGSTDVNSPASQ